MKFTVYITNNYEGNIWLSENNKIRVLAPANTVERQWIIRLDEDNEDNWKSRWDARKFGTMMEVILFLLDYCDDDIQFTYEKTTGTDGSGIDKMNTIWSKKDFPKKFVTVPATNISKRKMQL